MDSQPAPPRRSIGVQCARLLLGEAPEALKEIAEFDRAFIGGSGGNLSDILKWVDEHIVSNGRVVVNAVTLDTLTAAIEFFTHSNYQTNIIQVAVTRCEDIGNMSMLKALNPVFIITAWKEGR